jgi:hypothetical protein
MTKHLQITQSITLSFLLVIILSCPIDKAQAQTRNSGQQQGSSNTSERAFPLQGNPQEFGSLPAFQLPQAGVASASFPGVSLQPLMVRGYCFYVDNNSANTLFIPMKTDPEIQAFIDAAPQNNLQIRSLCPAKTVSICNEKGTMLEASNGSTVTFLAGVDARQTYTCVASGGHCGTWNPSPMTGNCGPVR